ncbi:hypothetical protein ABZ714_30825 [Streptomyces sp. NPDC006798]|uniref:hypothetical protein n=1 Tax=unclassified Streptomyces TaxID=2593676 RepID=UPI0033250D8D
MSAQTSHHEPAPSPLRLPFWRGNGVARKNILIIADGRYTSTGKWDSPNLIQGEGPMDLRQTFLCIELDGSVSHCPLTEIEEDLQVSQPIRRDEVRPETMLMAQAVKARRALRKGDLAIVEAFTAELGGRRGTGWPEAVSTALAGPWSDPLRLHGRLPLTAWDDLVADARRIYRQMLPLWKRRTSGARLLLLDTPLGDGASLYDLIRQHPSRPSFYTDSWTDSRIDAVLQVLRPQERTVVLAWAMPGIQTWADAAWVTGAQEADAAGERVRRKVRRIVRNQSWRAPE